MIATSSCRCTSLPWLGRSDGINAKSFAIDRSQFSVDLQFLTATPHPFGSDRQRVVAEYIQKRILESGAQALAQEFTVETPNPNILESNASAAHAWTLSKTGKNLLAFTQPAKKDCVTLLASHYDTKHIPGIEYVGANDSGSSSVLLLQLLAFVQKQNLSTTCEIAFVWFDGEESILDQWTDGEAMHPSHMVDNTYGSRFLAGTLTRCPKRREFCLPEKLGGKAITTIILLDMIGDANLQISMDTNSSDSLRASLTQIATDLGYSKYLAKEGKAIEDDHVPFRKLGIPAINLIDFENVYTWHNAYDTAGRVSVQSVEIAGRLALGLIN